MSQTLEHKPVFLPFSQWHIDQRKCSVVNLVNRCQFITLSIHLCLQHDGHDSTSHEFLCNS